MQTVYWDSSNSHTGRVLVCPEGYLKLKYMQIFEEKQYIFFLNL